MWCECCKADVAAELSSDHRRFSCTRCGTELGHAIGSSSRTVMPRLADSERDARELLARWSAMSVLEALPSPSEVPGPTAASTVRTEPPTIPSVGFVIPTTTTTPSDEPIKLTNNDDVPRRRRKRRRAVAPAVTPLVSASPSPAKYSWSQLGGHLAAYGGVGLLSLGMILVVWSYFGGPAAYAPTGWLLTTVGQMLLYLGVVTLVATGLEQTTDAVTLQMRQMDDKLARLEAASLRTRQSSSLRDAA
jgi:hypothetical protein